MRLSGRTAYAVQALFDLAFHCAGRAAQAREIAARQSIPPRYLDQILQDLRRAGLVEGKRGPHGGYTLRVPPEVITLRDVVEVTDGPADRLLCPEEGADPGAGVDVPDLVWRDLSERVADLLAQTTLQSLVERAEALGVARAAPAPQMYFI